MQKKTFFTGDFSNQVYLIPSANTTKFVLFP